MSRGKILIIEDSPDVRNVISEMVSVFGFDVDLAGDGLEGWRRLSAADYDLVICDMGLPELSGDKILQRMRQEGINTPVILIAGVDIKKRIFDQRTVSNFRFIQKPFEIDQVKNAIFELLQTSPARSDSPRDKKKVTRKTK